jgi:hypothetical protein
MCEDAPVPVSVEFKTAALVTTQGAGSALLELTLITNPATPASVIWEHFPPLHVVVGGLHAVHATPGFPSPVPHVESFWLGHEMHVPLELQQPFGQLVHVTVVQTPLLHC